jgi:hypothetical protein
MSFDDIALYYGLDQECASRARYLPERVPRQFGYVQSILRHPHATASIVSTVEQIHQHWMRYPDRVLTPNMLGSRVVCLTDTVPGYMEWYLQISHPYPRGILS